jgi:hypothetical protein
VIWVLIFLIGCCMAILVEGLSVAGLQVVSGSVERRTAAIDRHETMLLEAQRDATEIEAAALKKTKDRELLFLFVGVAMSAVGIFLSVALGDQFWELIFGKPTGLNWNSILPFFCASVVSVTLIQAELAKRLNLKSLVEIVTDLYLPKVAVAVQEQELQLDMMIDSYREVREDESVRGPAQEKIKKTLTRRLSGFADQVSIMADQAQGMSMVPPGSVVESIPTISHRPLALPAPRGKYGQYRDELLRLLRANPNLTEREVAAHFGVSPSTGSAWLKKAKSGQ